MKRHVLYTALITGFLSFNTALANDTYIGGSIGSSDFEGWDDKGTSFEIKIGHMFSKNFGVEASFINFGDTSDDIDPVWTIDAQAIKVAGIASLPVNDQLSVFAKAGFHSWELELEEDGAGKIDEADDTDFNFGFGAAYKVAQNISVDVQYNVYDFDGSDLDNISAGINYHF